MKPWISAAIGLAICLFVLWPLFLGRGEKRKSLAQAGKKHGRKMVGCIPIYKGQVYLVSGRRTKKLILPKGGVDHQEEPFYAAGKEALEEAGVIGEIDREPALTESGIDWYILDVKKVLNDWKERHERIRQLMTLEDALLHSEVRALTKIVLKAASLSKANTDNKRLYVPGLVLEPKE
ncbi:diphosphoinositol-polyphosphate diphosphatase [Nematocida displodere]|uniref:Diphosphoinositol-polyphosphate diphosphatase n=1 Tax=Nematocida displodere TaxID=1805483 RepID=A0A177EH95_9MICR|nr:diphosphoinositol-polyphosphate diphosphatase [Nematocida displodere]